MAYQMYLDGVLLPVTPAKIKMKIKNQNKTMTLINDSMINLLKSPGLTEIEFEALIPQVKYPFAVYQGGFKNAEYFLNKFEQLKTGRAPFQYIVSRALPSGKLLFDSNLKVSLEDYQIEEDSKDGFDLTVTFKLKQYRDYATKVVSIKEDKSATEEKVTVTVEQPRETESAPVVKTHTVVSGDCLWNLAKKYLGDGSRYPEIYELNKDKIKNPNLIYVGQVLIIPN